VVNIITYVDQNNMLSRQARIWLHFYQQDIIVTNSHVVHGASEIDIVFSDGSTQIGKLLGEDLHSDLAAIRVGTSGRCKTYPSRRYERGGCRSDCSCNRNPFGLVDAHSRIVSALDEQFQRWPHLKSRKRSKRMPQSIQEIPAGLYWTWKVSWLA